MRIHLVQPLLPPAVLGAQASWRVHLQFQEEAQATAIGDEEWCDCPLQGNPSTLPSQRPWPHT